MALTLQECLKAQTPSVAAFQHKLNEGNAAVAQRHGLGYALNGEPQKMPFVAEPEMPPVHARPKMPWEKGYVEPEGGFVAPPPEKPYIPPKERPAPPPLKEYPEADFAHKPGKPSPILSDKLEYLLAHRDEYDPERGLQDYDPASGIFSYSSGPRDVPLTSEKFKVDGNEITLLSDGTKISIPEKTVKDISGDRSSLWTDNFRQLVRPWKESMIKQQYEEITADFSASREKIKVFDDHTPKLIPLEGETGKYAPRMGLMECKPPHPISTSIPGKWFGGDPDHCAMVGDTANAIHTGNYDEKNIYHPPMALMMEASKKVNKEHHTDFIYRGETNVAAAKDLVRGIASDGEVQLADKMLSMTENEKLGKWYGAVHSQETARHTRSKSNMMLKVPYEKYADNVVFDYKAVSTPFTPEQEISILGNGIKLTGNDIMINSVPPGKEKKAWLSLADFMEQGGDVESFMNEMTEVPFD